MLTFTGRGKAVHVQRRDPARFPASRRPGSDRSLLAGPDGGPRGGGGEAGARRPLVHHDLQPRRTEQHGPLGHEAGRPGRDSRSVQAGPDRGAGTPALGGLAPARDDRRQVLPGALGASRRRGGARRRLADDADGAAVHRRRQYAARRGRRGISPRPQDATCPPSPSCRS